MLQRVPLISLMSPAFWVSDFSDPVLEFSSVGSFSADNESGLYDLRIMWGSFCIDSTVSEATDWSGSLSLGRGAEIIRRVIRFDSNQDSFLLHTDLRSIGWVFRTAIYTDGTAVDTVTPRPIPVLDSTANIDISFDYGTIVTTVVDTAYREWDSVEVVLETEPFRSTFTREEIGALDKLWYFDEADIGLKCGLLLDHVNRSAW